jgi:hypothetical protein
MITGGRLTSCASKISGHRDSNIKSSVLACENPVNTWDVVGHRKICLASGTKRVSWDAISY